MRTGQRRRRPGSGDGGWEAATAAGQQRRRLGSGDGRAGWATVTTMKMKDFNLNLEL